MIYDFCVLMYYGIVGFSVFIVLLSSIYLMAVCYIKRKYLSILPGIEKQNTFVLYFYSIPKLFFSFFVAKFLPKKSDKIVYNYDGKSFIIPKIKKESNIIYVLDEKDIDVTDYINMYYGMNNNWHGLELTPSILGKKELTFFTKDGREITFKENNVITL